MSKKTKKIEISEELKDEIEILISEKLSMRTIAEKYGISREYLYRIMRVMGIANKGGEYKVNGDELRRMVEEGMTYIDIAEHFDVSVQTIGYHIKKYGLNGKSMQVRQEIVKEKHRKELEKLKEDDAKKGGVICRSTPTSKTKKHCIYGSRFGSCDCCDYILVEHKRRSFDSENPERCFSYKYATKAEKTKAAEKRAGMKIS